jgi:glycine/D-amino acid oxidase-like deaminating enzyme
MAPFLCADCRGAKASLHLKPRPDILAAEREGLVVAAGGSGHAFKFSPLIGRLIADVAEGRPNRFAHRFAWRDKGFHQPFPCSI